MTIFDDLVSGIGKEVSKVQARSQEMLQGYNVQNQIKDIERKRTTKLLEIGRLICDKYNRNQDVLDDTLKDKANEVAGYEHEIGILQAELDSLKMTNSPDASQQQKAEAKAGYTATPGFECPSCSAPASKDKSFCPSCGESLRPSKSDDVVDVDTNGST